MRLRGKNEEEVEVEMREREREIERVFFLFVSFPFTRWRLFTIVTFELLWLPTQILFVRFRALSVGSAPSRWMEEVEVRVLK